MNHFSIPDNINFDDPQEAIKGLWAYIQAMQEQMEYFMRNIETENFNDKSLESLTKSITDPVTGQISELRVDVNGIDLRVDGVSATVTNQGIAINGLTVFRSDLVSGDTTISGGCIDTGSLNANAITAGTLTADQINGGTLRGVNVMSMDGVNSATLADAGLELISGNVNSLKLYIDQYGQYAYLNAGTLKIDSANSMSIESGGTVYIATDGGDVSIGSSTARIDLTGSVYINGVLQ